MHPAWLESSADQLDAAAATSSPSVSSRTNPGLPSVIRLRVSAWPVLQYRRALAHAA